MTLSYKGYTSGPIEFDEKQMVFSGSVAGLRNVIHFAGRTADELAAAFRDSIDDYLALCEELGRKPEKPYSGRFVLRLDPELHRKAAMQAQTKGLSLNAWIAQQVEGAAAD